MLGSAIRESSFSIVLLPAPLWPIKPDRFALLDLEGDIFERPEHVDLGLLAAADEAADGAPRSFGDGLAQ